MDGYATSPSRNSRSQRGNSFASSFNAALSSHAWIDIRIWTARPPRPGLESPRAQAGAPVGLTAAISPACNCCPGIRPDTGIKRQAEGQERSWGQEAGAGRGARSFPRPESYEEPVDPDGFM